MSEKKSWLTSIVRGRLAKPIRAVVYGVEGVGKSTFAADAPAPIFIGAEDGTAELDVARWTATSFSDVLGQLETLATEKHEFRTVAIDTLDWLEPRVWAHTLATRPLKNGGKATSIEDYGYGAGYVQAVEVWREVLAKLDACRAHGMNVVLIAHHHVKTMNNPAGDNFDRYEMKLHKLASALVKEWADAVLFATHEVATYKADPSNPKSKSKGIGTGARVLHTTHTAAFDAKNRYSLPDVLPLSWAAFVDAVADRRTLPLVDLNEQIDELVRSVDASLLDRVNTARAAAGNDPVALAKVLNRLKTTTKAVAA
jgi:hypothetical protein